MNNQQLKALHLIDRFQPKCEQEFWAFPLIQKEDFLESLKQLVANPLNISQGNHPICGITSAIKVAAALDPVSLVKMSAHFFANGKYETPSFLLKSIKVPKVLKKSENTAGLSAASYVLQTTIKSFYNPLTGYNSKPGNKYNEWQGITFPHQVSNFLTNYFRIQRVPAKTFFHTIKEIQSLLNDGNQIIAWTSWNQMKNPGGRFKLLQQHYVVIKSVENVEGQIHLSIDNPRKGDESSALFKFENEKQFYSAIIGIYAFKRKA